jgi:hypothetical protein
VLKHLHEQAAQQLLFSRKTSIQPLDAHADTVRGIETTLCDCLQPMHAVVGAAAVGS